MNLETLVANATDDELPAIAAALHRAQSKPCVLVTTLEGGKRRRYVVAQEDEDEIRKYVGCAESVLDRQWQVWFGAQWLRGMGRVDEMYRSLSLSETVKVEEADRARVWGR